MPVARGSRSDLDWGSAFAHLESRTLLDGLPVGTPFVELLSTVPSPSGQSTPVRGGDFNADGVTDYVSVATRGVAVRLAEARGALATPTRFGLGGDVLDVVAADCNSDGVDDLVVLARAASLPSVRVLINDGRGHFRVLSKQVLLGVPSGELAFADFDHDGSPEVVVASGLAPETFGSLLKIDIHRDGTLAAPSTVVSSLPGVLGVDVVAAYVGGPPVLQLTLARGFERLLAIATPLLGTASTWGVKYLTSYKDHFQTTYSLTATPRSPDALGDVASYTWTVGIARPDGSLSSIEVFQAPVNLAALRVGHAQPPWITQAFASRVPDDTSNVIELDAVGVLAGTKGPPVRVDFFFDADDDGVLTAADQRIGSDVDGTDGWSFSAALQDEWVSQSPLGTNFFARAFDAAGNASTTPIINLLL